MEGETIMTDEWHVACKSDVPVVHKESRDVEKRDKDSHRQMSQKKEMEIKEERLKDI